VKIEKDSPADLTRREAKNARRREQAAIKKNIQAVNTNEIMQMEPEEPFEWTIVFHSKTEFTVEKVVN